MRCGRGSSPAKEPCPTEARSGWRRAPRRLSLRARDAPAGRQRQSRIPAPRSCVPRASSAPRWAAPSISRASPLTTTKPRAANSKPSRSAILSPASLAARAPTTATQEVSPGSIKPRAIRYGVGSAICLRFDGYSASVHRTRRAPSRGSSQSSLSSGAKSPKLAKARATLRPTRAAMISSSAALKIRSAEPNRPSSSLHVRGPASKRKPIIVRRR